MKKISITIVLLLLTSIVFSQKDTTIYYSNSKKTLNSSDKAQTYQKVKKISDNEYLLNEFYKNTYDKEDTEWHEGSTCHINKINDSTYTFSYPSKTNEKDNTSYRIFKKVDNGYFIKIYVDNKLRGFGFSTLIFPLIQQGEWTIYYPNSDKFIMKQTYLDNQAISNKRWDENGVELLSDVFDRADEMPEFDGGMEEMNKFLFTNLKYPMEDREEGTTGTIYVTFVVMEDGSLSEIKILRSLSKSLDAEALRVVKLMEKKWKAGKNNGKPVRVQFNLPLRINLK